MNRIALSYLLTLLARRDYSAMEIRYKMAEKAFSAEDIEQVLLHCQQQGWQSDRRFCESYLSSRSRKGYGPTRIRQELQQKGIENPLIHEQLQQCDLDWFALAETTFHKKYPEMTGREWTPALQQKAWRFMLSRGFKPDHFSHLINAEPD
ncbi:recombination regulator RecX [Chelonobacter oris]|nr:recombination regulator RecX [Chelonobacter oris]MDH3001659.1 recombination regulator RecX [Chelonobacter oris]